MFNSINSTNNDLANKFIYDTGATSHLVNNIDLIYNVEDMKHPKLINGISGQIEVVKVGILKGFGKHFIIRQLRLICYPLQK